MYSHLISVKQLQDLVQKNKENATNKNLMIFDCSYDLFDTNLGFNQYLQEHLPNAIYVNLDKNLSSHNLENAVCGGRHPLPKKEILVDWLSEIGFTNETQAVVYDRQNLNFCGRLWWILKWLGHEKVAVLDGGFNAWKNANLKIYSGENLIKKTLKNHKNKFEIKPELTEFISLKELKENFNKFIILDARAKERFLGKVEPIDPIAGHIPNAINRHFALNLDENGFFKSPSILKKEFEELLINQDLNNLIHHCGSGVSAIPNIIAIELAGLKQKNQLYTGGWSEFCQFKFL